MKYAATILNKLLDVYEHSATFKGENTRRQSFNVDLAKLFPAYSDDANYEVFVAVNESVEELERAELVTAVHKRNGVIEKVCLNTGAIDKIYARLKRTPRRHTQEMYRAILEPYRDNDTVAGLYCAAQLERLDKNKDISGADSPEQLATILRVLDELEKLKKDTFERDFSARVLGDSKAFAAIRSTIISILTKNSRFADAENVLNEYNLVRNPGHVFCKGEGIIKISGQCIDCRALAGDIGLSSLILDDITEIKVKATRVITIENLTTFNTFSEPNSFVIYLGGYHNAVRRRFIRKVYAQNPKLQYLHFGDIDAGGLQILIHLVTRTGIVFKPYRMDVATLAANLDKTTPLTDHDRLRLEVLRAGGSFTEVIDYMLAHNCKLEQEQLDSL